MRFTFTERLNIQKCINVLNQSKAETKDMFWVRDDLVHGTDKRDWNSYIIFLKKFLRQVVQADGVMTKEYKFAENQSAGRIYVKGGGIQSLQKKLRNYLCGEYYYDFDIVNCHPRLLLYLCYKHQIPCTYLEQYIQDRETILANTDLTKTDILCAINTDQNKKKKNDWYNCFIFELHQLKTKLIVHLENMNIVTTNQKNPVSSTINKYLCILENDIIQTVIQYFANHAEVPMFDGLMVHKEFCATKDLSTHVHAINDMFKEKYMGLVEFVTKPTDCDIEINELDEAIGEYNKVKERFEKDHFMTLHPYIFWKKNRNSDGSYSYNQLKEGEFKNACKEYQILDYKPNGEMFTTSIFEKWIADKTRRLYECTDFLPFGKEDICPSYVYNTFDGFAVNTIKEWNDVDTSNFNTLIYHLCNEDVDMTSYMVRFIAHMFQYPNVLPEKIIVFKSWTGSGKDTLFRTLQLLMGHKHVDITENIDSIFGNFNDILRDKLCLFMNELEGKEGIVYQERIKGQVTAIRNKVNQKHEKVITQNNFCRLFVNSNNDGCVSVQTNDRRYVIIKSGFGLVANTKDEEKRKTVRTFWDTYYNNIKSTDWQKSLYTKLMNIDLSDFDPSNDPASKAKEVMKDRNINPLYQYLNKVLKHKPYKGFTKKDIKGTTFHLIKWKEFMQNFEEWAVTNLHIEYRLKDADTRDKLLTIDKNFLHNRQICYTNDKGEQKRAKYACFDMSKMKAFLDDFVFPELDEDIIDVGSMSEPMTKMKIRSSDCL